MPVSTADPGYCLCFITLSSDTVYYHGCTVHAVWLCPHVYLSPHHVSKSSFKGLIILYYLYEVGALHTASRT